MPVLLAYRPVSIVRAAAGWRRAWLAVLGLAALVTWGSAAPAQAPAAASERGVKAAYVYKFLGYVEWPAAAFAQADAPMVIGVVGADEVATELTEIVRGRAVGGHPVEVRKLRPGESTAGLHVLFIGAAERARAPPLIRAAHARGAMTITETDDGLEQGSVINLVVMEGRVRFEVSLEAAERAGIKLSSRLLAVAHLVRMGNN